MKINVVILAAGQSSRMHSNTNKVLQKVAGLELINHILRNLEKLNISESILVCDEHFNFDNRSNIKITKVFQGEKLGTGYAVKVAKDLLKYEVSLILYGDTPLISEETILKLINSVINEDNDLSLLLFDLKDVNKPYGRAILNEDKVQSIIEFEKLSDLEKGRCTIANSGVIAAKTAILNQYLPQIKNDNKNSEYYLTDIVKIAKKNDKKIGFIITNEREAIGINARSDLADAEYFYQEFLRNKFLKGGVTLVDKGSVYFSHDAKIENDVTIYPNVFIGTGVEIKANVEILSFSHLEGVVIGSNSKIGPFARIRGNTIVGESCNIGNFVEIKNSNLDKNVKIKHLSYIGDTKIGNSSNIGAGTITCNFDGKNKHKTIIGKDCFIGANNTIIAPLQIHDSARTGGGSIITEDIPEDNLAIARSKQVNKKVY